MNRAFARLFGGLARLRETGETQRWEFWNGELGIWLTLAQCNIQDEAMAQGIPVLRGPYIADHADIPHDGDTVTLWTPQAGDVLLKLFTDLGTVVQWDQGALSVRYKFVPTPAAGWILTSATHPNIGGGFGGLDFESEGVNGSQRHASVFVGTTGFVFDTPDPVVLYYDALGSGTLPSQGHIELYALVARPVAP